MTESIGARIREARMARGMSLRSVAQSVGVSASLISQVETGKTQPSVSTLYAIVNHLGISIDQLLDVVAPAEPTHLSLAADASMPTVQRGDENAVLEMENGVRWERLSAGAGGPADALLVTYDPGAASSVEGKLMRHAGVEYAYLLEGELVLQLEFDEHVIRAGDSLHFDSVRPHQYVNRGSVPARGVWFVVGRRQHNSSMPSAPGAAHPDGSLSSAVDVLRALDTL
ncbi:MAG TPA: helix-turn-helix domain-containing protein [Rhodoglobus sp.]|nr:helix-turn-helix domain-containing protein [Rhodoglobus sp.]